MENPNYISALEITNSCLRLAVGFLSKDGTPCLICYREVPLAPGVVSNWAILDQDALVTALQSFHDIQDESTGLHITPQNLCVVLPPRGFLIYQVQKATTLVGGDTVGSVDVTNCLSLIRQEKLPETESTIVDIVPDFFVAGNAKYAYPPLGQKGTQLTITAKLHTLPKETLATFRAVVESAGFRVYRTAVAPYCASELLTTMHGYPDTYFLLDFGAEFTSLSAIGQNSVIRSRFFAKGSANLSRQIAEELDLPFTEANWLKERYGYDLAEHRYTMSLLGPNGASLSKKVGQKELNAAILHYFEQQYNPNLVPAIGEVATNKETAFRDCPILITGGGAELRGIGSLLAPVLQQRTLYGVLPSVLGARTPKATNVLGMIVAEGKHKTSESDIYRGVSTLSRESASGRGGR